MAFFQDLKARGLVFQTTGDAQFEAWLSDKPRILYCGFDPTADSLHIGSLVPLLMLRRFQLAGHTPIALVGGATGLIGDPSFKAQERALNTPDVVSEWVSRLRTQMSQFLSFEGDTSAVMANNLDWTANVDVLTFLRDVGKHFSVNNMIAKESVKQRIEREGAGISFTEFTYMILQSFDFAELNKRYGCELQIGGSDQWGNITGGVDLTRRMNSAQVQGLTMPLVTKADGTKFGKTESGTIWLDAKKTSPYAFYQFWLSTADADVYTFLKYFTFLSVSDIDALEQEDAEREGRPQAQMVLAQEVTRLVHTDVGLEAAERITQAMFNGEEGALSESDLAQLSLDGLPSSTVARAELPATLTQLLTDAGMVTSGKQVKDALGRSAVVINGKPVSVDDNANPQKCFAIDSAMHGQYFITRLGKKKVHLFTVV
ncbi:tyrosine--tRNA ligase [Luminiphilus sp.]|jgi:tyrosyl-tRNA synthetase|nr:tyrosine--tRNA ligase [Luminiphilus sp.]MDA8814109.1 tyrosine--tRNA ligase [Luminiphilus sp.]MDA9836692.1 tyrosine--tRNA ligase [Luminiphilus sp.]MDA9878031.1 tyrosine--tRNA ligase [Luminiphilus sp.]MDC0973218.1 tyrosine--tRNA ligase [Luminiphilus sp.]